MRRKTSRRKDPNQTPKKNESTHYILALAFIVAALILIGALISRMQLPENQQSASAIQRECTSYVEVINGIVDLEMKDIKGNTLTMNNFEDQDVFLYFWGQWSTPSKEGFELLEEIQYEVGSDQLALVGISLDAFVQSSEDIAYDTSLSWPLVCDGFAWESPLVTAFEIQDVPAVVHIGRNGRILHTFQDVDGIDQDKIRKYLERTKKGKKIKKKITKADHKPGVESVAKDIVPKNEEIAESVTPEVKVEAKPEKYVSMATLLRKRPKDMNYIAWYWILTHPEKKKDILSLAKKALKEKPGDKPIEDTLAWAYYLNEEYEKALKHSKSSYRQMLFLTTSDRLVRHSAILYRNKQTKKGFRTYLKSLQSYLDAIKESRKFMFNIEYDYFRQKTAPFYLSNYDQLGKIRTLLEDSSNKSLKQGIVMAVLQDIPDGRDILLRLKKEGVLTLEDLAPLEMETGTLSHFQTALIDDDTATLIRKKKELDETDVPLFEQNPYKTEKLFPAITLFAPEPTRKGDHHLLVRGRFDAGNKKRIEAFLSIQGLQSKTIWLNGKRVFREKKLKPVKAFSPRLAKVHLLPGVNTIEACLSTEKYLDFLRLQVLNQYQDPLKIEEVKENKNTTEKTGKRDDKPENQRTGN